MSIDMEPPDDGDGDEVAVAVVVGMGIFIPMPPLPIVVWLMSISILGIMMLEIDYRPGGVLSTEGMILGRDEPVTQGTGEWKSP